MFIRVDLPEPDGPMMATYSPRSISSETSRSAWMVSAPIWYRRETFCSRIRDMERTEWSDAVVEEKLQATNSKHQGSYKPQSTRRSESAVRRSGLPRSLRLEAYSLCFLVLLCLVSSDGALLDFLAVFKIAADGPVTAGNDFLALFQPV